MNTTRITSLLESGLFAPLVDALVPYRLKTTQNLTFKSTSLRFGNMVLLCTLLGWTPAESLAQPLPTLPDIAAIQKELEARFAMGGRYMIGTETLSKPYRNCVPLEAKNPIFQDELGSPYKSIRDEFPESILECIYPRLDGKTQGENLGWVILLVDTAKNLAKRVHSSCKAVVVESKIEECNRKLLAMLLRDNGLQFPITGFVQEGPENCSPASNLPGLIGFRHGVTIKYFTQGFPKTEERYCLTEGNITAKWQMNTGLQSASFKVYNIARIGSLTRSGLPLNERPVDFDRRPKGREPDGWQVVVIENEIRAIRSGYDRLMILRAAELLNVKPQPAVTKPN